MTRAPDVLVLIADCVAARELGGSSPGGSGLPNIASLAEHGISCSRAVSPSNWTLPSHASMFTGLDPWDHGTVEESRPLPKWATTFAQKTLSSGYRTASFSANPYVCDTTGLTKGFETAVWGRWGECYLRGFGPISTPTGRVDFPTKLDLRDPPPREQGGYWIRRFVSRSLVDLPIVPELLTRLGPQYGGEDGARGPAISSWMESLAEDWMKRIPPSRPLLAFVNLMDAHEPYLGVSHGKGELKRLWSDWRASSSGARFSRERVELPRHEYLARLHQLYRRGIEIVDSRIGSLLSMIKRHRGLDRTVVIFSADHGQAFGEGGALFHRVGTEDVLFRVPLIVSWPGSQPSREDFQSWVSTSSIYSMVDCLTREPQESRKDTALRALRDESLRRPIWGLGNTLTLPQRRSRGAQRRPAAAPSLVGYWGNSKVVLRSTSQGWIVDSDLSSLSVEDRTSFAVDEIGRLGIRTPKLGGLPKASDGGESAAVSKRLIGWGYA